MGLPEWQSKEVSESIPHKAVLRHQLYNEIVWIYFSLLLPSNATNYFRNYYTEKNKRTLKSGTRKCSLTRDPRAWGMTCGEFSVCFLTSHITRTCCQGGLKSEITNRHTQQQLQQKPVPSGQRTRKEKPSRDWVGWPKPHSATESPASSPKCLRQWWQEQSAGSPFPPPAAKG